MQRFKFLQEPPKFTDRYTGRLNRIYGWNAYETLVMNVYKFCYNTESEFIGFSQSFWENNVRKILNITNFIVGPTHTVIVYQIVEPRQSIYTLRISNEDLITIQQHEYI